jgi:hypothetical protein
VGVGVCWELRSAKCKSISAHLNVRFSTRMMGNLGISTLSKMNSCHHTLRGLLLSRFVGAKDVGGPVGE